MNGRTIVNFCIIALNASQPIPKCIGGNWVGHSLHSTPPTQDFDRANRISGSFHFFLFFFLSFLICISILYFDFDRANRISGSFDFFLFLNLNFYSLFWVWPCQQNFRKFFLFDCASRISGFCLFCFYFPLRIQTVLESCLNWDRSDVSIFQIG